MRRINCDVLVVGGGGAGLMAAYEATKTTGRVALVSKGKVQRSGATVMAPGAIAAVDDRWKAAEDSQKLHFTDTLQGGAWMNEQDKVKMMVEQSADLVMELERMGAIFHATLRVINHFCALTAATLIPAVPIWKTELAEKWLEPWSVNSVNGMFQSMKKSWSSKLFIRIMPFKVC